MSRNVLNESQLKYSPHIDEGKESSTQKASLTVVWEIAIEVLTSRFNK